MSTPILGDEMSILKDKVKNTRVSVVDEVEYGTYLWKMPDGSYVSDGEQNFLAVMSMRGDLSRIAKLSEVARAYGIDEGGPIFFPGMRMISDEEHAEQTQRLAEGYIPDDHDIPALVDAAKAQKAGLTDD